MLALIWVIDSFTHSWLFHIECSVTHHVHVIWLFAVYVCVFTSKQAKQVALYASMFGSAVPNTTEIRISDWTSTIFTSRCWVWWLGGFRLWIDWRCSKWKWNELKTYSTILYHTTGVHHVERRTTLNNATEKCARGTVPSTTCVYPRTEIISYLLLSDDHEQITKVHVLGKHQVGIPP